MKGATDRIRRMLRKHNLQPIFKPHQRIDNIIEKSKDKNRIRVRKGYIPIMSKLQKNIHWKDQQRDVCKM